MELIIHGGFLKVFVLILSDNLGRFEKLHMIYILV